MCGVNGMNYYDISRKVSPSLIHHNSWHKVCVDHFSILIPLLLRCTEMKYVHQAVYGVCCSPGAQDIYLATT